MSANTDAFRRFQEELAALDRAAQHRSAATCQEAEMARAKSEFLLLRKRYTPYHRFVVLATCHLQRFRYLRQKCPQNPGNSIPASSHVAALIL